jgi:BNR-Asp box repeat
LGVTRSKDRGKTWTRVFNLPGIGTNPRNSDKPIIAMSSDGKHVCIGFNARNSYVSAPHNFGKNFSLLVKTSSTNRTFFHTGGGVAADGTVYFSTTDFGSGYQGDSNVRFLKSTDRGKTWITTLVDTSREVAGCSSIAGCYFGFLGPSAAMAIDAAGKIMIAYHANNVAGTPQRMYIRTSLDGRPLEPSQRDLRIQSKRK